jgi:ribosomal protein S18 acetylase RimI-like enzyme
MTSDIASVRALAISDYERWMSVWQRSGLHSVRLHGRDSRDAFARQLATRGRTMLGLELNGELVGVVLATHDGRKGWINRLAVLPEYRRRGFARRLLDEAERLLRDHGITVIAALIEPGNDGSLAFFRRSGYVDLQGIHYVSKRDRDDA